MFPEFAGCGTEEVCERAAMFERCRAIRSTPGDFFVALFMPPPPPSTLPHIPSEPVSVSTTTPHWQLALVGASCNALAGSAAAAACRVRACVSSLPCCPFLSLFPHSTFDQSFPRCCPVQSILLSLPLSIYLSSSLFPRLLPFLDLSLPPSRRVPPPPRDKPASARRPSVGGRDGVPDLPRRGEGRRRGQRSRKQRQ